MSDGNLRLLFRQHLPHAHWQPIETWSTGQGVPDVEYCFPGGFAGWIENKSTSGLVVKFRVGQVAWLERRSRAGGRCFVAVRKGARLWVFRGRDARAVEDEGLRAERLALLCCDGGPARWGWPRVEEILKS